MPQDPNAKAYQSEGTCLLIKVGGVFTEISRVISISGPGLQREQLEVTHLKSPDKTKEFIGGLKEGSSFSFTVQMNPQLPDFLAVLNSKNDPTTDFKVVWSDDLMTPWEFTASFETSDPTAEQGGVLECAFAFKISGPITGPGIVNV